MDAEKKSEQPVEQQWLATYCDLRSHVAVCRTEHDLSRLAEAIVEDAAETYGWTLDFVEILAEMAG